MNNDSGTSFIKKNDHPKGLFISTTIYAVLYFIMLVSFYVDGFVDGFKGVNAEIIIVNVAFIIFMIGYYFCRKNELNAALIFIFWWGIMWGVGLFIAEHDRGVGVVIGLPVFIFGLLFLRHWYKKRSGSGS